MNLQNDRPRKGVLINGTSLEAGCEGRLQGRLGESLIRTASLVEMNGHFLMVSSRLTLTSLAVTLLCDTKSERDAGDTITAVSREGKYTSRVLWFGFLCQWFAGILGGKKKHIIIHFGQGYRLKLV